MDDGPRAPEPIRHVNVPKPGGGTRAIAVLGPGDGSAYERAVARLADVIERALGPGVVANRVLPPDPGGSFAGLREIQQRYLPVVEQEFGPVPVRTVPMFDREMVGIERLREVGLALFGDGDPAEILYRGRPYEVIKEADAYVLKLELPFASKDEVRLSRTGDELVLHVGTW